jgi:hypothetical protein
VVLWELVLCEKFWARPPCDGGFVYEFLGILVPRKVAPSNPNPSTIELTGVCDGTDDVLVKLETPPKIGGKFLKRLERRGYCGSPMILD